MSDFGFEDEDQNGSRGFPGEIDTLKEEILELFNQYEQTHDSDG
jgi:hypothetical protein